VAKGVPVLSLGLTDSNPVVFYAHTTYDNICIHFHFSYILGL